MLRMTPCDFDEATKEMIATSDSTKIGVGHRITEGGTEHISCWKLDWRERISALLFGLVWLSVIDVEKHPPVWIQADRRFQGES